MASDANEADEVAVTRPVGPGTNTERRDADEADVDFEVLPDDLTEKEEQILRIGLLHPEASIEEVRQRVALRYYGGDLEEAPRNATVNRVLHSKGNAENRLDGRSKVAKQRTEEVREQRLEALDEAEPDEDDFEMESSDIDITDLEPDDDDEDERVEISTGNGSYEGPAGGIDLTQQYISERPVKSVDADDLDGEDVDLPDDADSVYVVTVPIKRDATQSGELSDDELLEVIEALVAGGADRSLVRHFAAQVE